MGYIKKNVTMKRDEFKQLFVYFLQVKETVDTLQERNTKQFNISHWIEALQIHTEILDKYINKIADQNHINDRPDLNIK